MNHLDKGIFFEDSNTLLEWGHSVEKLVKENKANIIQKSDRVIIEWGTHTLLNGLQLELSNVFLLTNPDKFKSIEFQTSGDKQSFLSFEQISKHLLNLFGKPTVKDDDMENKRERLWSWNTNGVKITLYLFEQHAFKLHFKIEQIQN